jgi:hypothetical protein
MTEPKHAGCFFCHDRTEPVLTSGVTVVWPCKSVAICSRPECREQVRMVDR